MIERHFCQALDQEHIDLRYVLAGLGLKGGLKSCEAQLEMSRGDLDDVVGIFAVVLWKAYLRNRDEQALETLLAYNLQDTINLESLMITAYNMKMDQTPFEGQFKIPPCKPPQNPIPVHRHTIERYRKEVALIHSLQPRW